MADVVIHKLTTLELLYKRCKACDEVTVFGFHHQVEWKRISEGVYTEMVCSKCGDTNRLVLIPEGTVHQGAGI